MSLTPKQAQFVDEYVVDFNGTQAAIRAGYSEKTAYAIAAENLKKPEIAQAIEARKQGIAQRLQITADDIARRAWAIAQQDKPDRVAALALLAKRHPEFRDNAPDRPNQTLVLNGLTDAQLDEAIRSLSGRG